MSLERIAALLFKRGKFTWEEIREIVGAGSEVSGGDGSLGSQTQRVIGTSCWLLFIWRSCHVRANQGNV